MQHCLVIYDIVFQHIFHLSYLGVVPSIDIQTSICTFELSWPMKTHETGYIHHARFTSMVHSRTLYWIKMDQNLHIDQKVPSSSTT